jgi:hypothetical protein
MVELVLDVSTSSSSALPSSDPEFVLELEQPAANIIASARSVNTPTTQEDRGFDFSI